MLKRVRQHTHQRILQVLEAQFPETAATSPELLAHHALRGEQWDKALAYFRQAGEQALARSAYREAVAAFEQALIALQHLPDSRDTREQAIDLRLALRTALRPLGYLGRILVALREAEALAEALNDPWRLGQVFVFLSQHFSNRGAYDQAIAAAQRALALATASGEIVIHALANFYLGSTYEAQGNYDRAIDCLRQTVASFDGARRHERVGQVTLPSVHSRAYLAWCHAELGAFAEGRACGEEGLHIAEEVAHPASLMWASWGMGLLSLRQGDVPKALSWLERAVGICHEADLVVYSFRMAAALGEAYTLGERVADAVSLLTQTMTKSVATERPPLEILCSLSLGEAHMVAGRLEEAHVLAERALALARGHQERGHQACVLRLLGAIAARPFRAHASRSALPAGPRSGRGAWHAPAPGPLPP